MAGLVAAALPSPGSAQTYLRQYRSGPGHVSIHGIERINEGLQVATGLREIGELDTEAHAMGTDLRGGTRWIQDYVVPHQSTGFLGLARLRNGQLVSVGTAGVGPWIVGLDPETGDVRWNRQLLSAGSYGAVSPAADGSSVFAVGSLVVLFGRSDLLVSHVEDGGSARWHDKIVDATSTLRGVDVAAAPDGGVFVAALRGPAGPPRTPVLLSLDAAGDLRWARELLSFPTGAIQLALTTTAEGEVVLAASDGESLHLSRYTAAGVERSERVVLGERLVPESLCAHGPDGVALTATVVDEDGLPRRSWLAAFDANGEIEHQHELGDAHYSRLLDLSPTVNGWLAAGAIAPADASSEGWIVRSDDRGEVQTGCPIVVETFHRSVSVVTSSRVPTLGVERLTDISREYEVTPVPRGVAMLAPCWDTRLVQFVDLGPGTEGSGTFVPDLRGTEGFVRGENAELELRGALGGAYALAYLSPTAAPLPIFGGIFHPNLAGAIPLKLRIPGPSGVPGAGEIRIALGPQLSGLQDGDRLVLQMLIADPVARDGVALSSAIQISIVDD